MTETREFRGTVRVELIGETENARRILVVEREGKSPLGRPRHMWENNTVTCSAVCRNYGTVVPKEIAKAFLRQRFSTVTDIKLVAN
jgi:hypothetical protein